MDTTAFANTRILQKGWPDVVVIPVHPLGSHPLRPRFRLRLVHNAFDRTA
jgi:hypothetical protein